jgi:two-component system response regulator YesN
MNDFKLLLVDDEEGVRNAIARMVDWSSIGVKLCAPAKDGVDALEKVREYCPDILLMDIRMPGKTGLEVIAEIACHDEWIIKSVILSGYDDFAYAQKALRLGAVDYLLKPCMPEDILKAVDSAKQSVIKERERRSLKQGMGERPATDRTTGHRFIDAAIEHIRENYDKDISLAATAEAVFLSPGYFCTLFRQYTGQNYVDYLNGVRLNEACRLLSQSLMKTYEIAYAVGFRDETYFTKLFKKQYGVSPSEHRKRGNVKESL